MYTNNYTGWAKQFPMLTSNLSNCKVTSRLKYFPQQLVFLGNSTKSRVYRIYPDDIRLTIQISLDFFFKYSPILSPLTRGVH